jgi:2-keto-4-pentenoate hydratase/2-oxohepta-3-ene-1,7-dioic acid hydratase in catechol pathway
VTADDIPDPQNLNITTRLNGQTVQQDNTGSMLYSIAELIAYISTFSALSPGDVILTGTPGGIGKNVPRRSLCSPGTGWKSRLSRSDA